MKSIRFSLLAIIPMLLLTTSCYKEGGVFGIKGTGPVIEESRHIGNSFTKIDMGISADVYLTQGATESVTIEAQSNILDNIETYVKGSTLKIRFKRNVFRHNGIRIYISNPDYEGVEISGSGSVTNDTPLDCHNLDLQVSGSGSIEMFDVVVNNDLDQTITGSGHIYLEQLAVDNDIYTLITGSGKIYNEGSQAADYMKVSITGSGNIKTVDFPVNRVKANISGSGSCRVWAVSELDATITGSGSVYYRGNPLVTTHITGSGRVLTYN